MKRLVAVIGMAVLSVAGFFGFGALAEKTAIKGYDPYVIEDVMKYTTGVAHDEVVAYVDGQPVLVEDYLYWLAYNAEMYHGAMFGEEEPDWSWTTAGDTPTLEEYVKEQTMESVKLYRIVKTKAEKLGCGLTAEQKAAYQETVKLTEEQLGGKAELDKYLLKSCINRNSFEAINNVPVLYQNIADAQVDQTPVSDAEMAEYIKENDMLRAKHILLSTIDLTTREPLDTETIAAKKKLAEQLHQELSQSKDLLTAFDELMYANTEDPGTEVYMYYDFTAGEMEETFEATVRSLEYGEMSGVVESAYGYHIILRLDRGDEVLRRELTAARVQEESNALLSGWMESAEVETTEVFDRIGLDAFYDNLMGLREDIAAADAAAAK